MAKPMERKMRSRSKEEAKNRTDEEPITFIPLGPEFEKHSSPEATPYTA
jgi:hypothetical protein